MSRRSLLPPFAILGVTVAVAATGSGFWLGIWALLLGAGLCFWCAVRCIHPRRKPQKFRPLSDEERATFDAIAATLKSERAENGGDS